MLSFPSNTNTLKKLHSALLLKLGIIKTFPVAIRSVPTHLGGLNLHSLEIEMIAQMIHHLVSLYLADTLRRALLHTIIEYHQLELGTDEQFFSLDFEYSGVLATPTWVTTL